MSEATATPPLTVVLMHGVFAASSSWTSVIEHLRSPELSPSIARELRKQQAILEREIAENGAILRTAWP